MVSSSKRSSEIQVKSRNHEMIQFLRNFTSVNAGEFFPKVNQSRQFSDTIFASISGIIDFDKRNV